MIINKFAVLNAMQKSCHLVNTGKKDGDKTWDLRISHTYQGVTRVRTVGFIAKCSVNGKYYVSRISSNGSFKNFMQALAAMFQVFCDACYDLMRSMRFGEKTPLTNNYEYAVADITKTRLLMSVEKSVIKAPEFYDFHHNPTYAKGAKKSVLKGLRHSLNTFFFSKGVI
ncbi:hypothetical protein [Yersinia phage vB_YenM_P778]